MKVKSFVATVPIHPEAMVVGGGSWQAWRGAFATFPHQVRCFPDKGKKDAFLLHKSVGIFFRIWYKDSFHKSRKMPKVCEICGKGPVFGQSLSHSHKASKKKWKPNLQQIKAQTKTGAKRIWVCTRCLRSGKVVKAL